MNTINFDTLKAAKSLQDAGFETRQAEAVVGMVTYALSEGLATKEDVRDLKFSLQSSIDALDVKIDALEVRIDADMRDLKSSLQSSIDALDVKIDNGLAALDSKIDSSVAALEVKIDNGLNNMIQKLTIVLGGIVVASVTLLGVLIRVFLVLPAP